MYALFTQIVSDEALDRISTKDGFEAAENERDPLQLLILIKNEHSLHMNDVTGEEAKYVAQMRYNRMRQIAGMPLTEYLERFEMAVANMTALGCAGIPDEKRKHDISS